MSTLRHYTDDFRKDAVQYAEEHPDMTLQQTADYLGVPRDTLYGWIKASRRKSQKGNISPAAPLTDAEKEIARLRRENRDLQDALAVLKKAIGILND